MLSLANQRKVFRLAASVRQLSGPPIVANPSLKRVEIINEPLLGYMKGSEERATLDRELQHRLSVVEEVPLVIAGREHWSDDIRYQTMPHDHGRVLAKFCYANKELLAEAVEAALGARRQWEAVPLNEKIDVFLKAGDLAAGPYRPRLMAATMLGQGKTVFQAEIDAAAELADFFRFNAAYAQQLYDNGPVNVDATIHNSVRQRGLEGFVAAISPFNFTAIGGNLAYTPALMGNVVLWKPSDTAVLSNYLVFRLMEEAGIPAGVVNFVPADGPTFGRCITSSPHLSAINFTGSPATFHWLWTQVGANVAHYRNLPRLVGECGGKNFHLVHRSADMATVVNATLRGAFEYSGQKCSATSRLYVPASLWPQIRDGLVSGLKEMKVGAVTEWDAFTSAVIDRKAYDRIVSYIEHARASASATILAGGRHLADVGYFVQPTLIETSDAADRLMTDEIFGPVLTAFVYDDERLDETMRMVDETTPYALTGAVFAEDRAFLERAAHELKMSAGNFYINDKSTGAVVGQQPFGGSRLSGTNDKAGSPSYLLRWSSPQAVKQSFIQQAQWKYPHMEA